jgi:hypothetical protein
MFCAGFAGYPLRRISPQKLVYRWQQLKYILIIGGFRALHKSILTEKSEKRGIVPVLHVFFKKAFPTPLLPRDTNQHGT